MRNFNLGILFGINSYGIWQDVLGKIGYLNVLKTNWLDVNITLPLHIGVAVIIIILIKDKK